ncbi:leucine rich repeat family protein [Anaeramoeba flamelloides]|uniref:Leucine rich repeat family protein n=1 Tax=Anaeramoeba flamelloides TaxID=1746091 RepID=A0AAV7YZQ4_9EUKA|nr:leucine rich repeat family protein [Anaeramoeba flamelloides]
MKALCKVLKVNQSLINLDLSLNRIGAKGIEALREALKVNQTLISLVLYYNQIRDKGVEYLSHAIKVNQTLTQLDLDDNKIGYSENKQDHEKIIQEFIQSLKINKSIVNLKIRGNKINKEEDKRKIDNLIERNLDFQKKLTQSVKVGNLQLFQELIQIEKIPLIYQQFDDDEEIYNPNNQEENTIFHTAIFHNQTEILFYLLFANNEKTDQQIISKRNFLLNLKNFNSKKKSVIDWLNPNEILIQDFKNYYNQFISSSSSYSSQSSSSFYSSTSYFNNNEKSNNFPNKLIAEKEIILMRIGKEWKTIKNEFQNELTKKQKQLFLKWLYCPVSLKFQEKQTILEVFKLLNINQFKKQTLFSNEKLLNDFQNYIKKYANSEKKIFQINLKKKKMMMTATTKKKNENKNDNFKIKSIQINKFILCLRSNLFREMIFQTFPFQLENEKEMEKKTETKKEKKKIRKEKENEQEKKKENENETKKKLEKETERKKENETKKENKKGKRKEKERGERKINLTINQVTDYFTSIPEFYPFFLSELYNLNLTPIAFTFDFENLNFNKNNNNKHNIQKICNNNNNQKNVNNNNNQKKNNNNNNNKIQNKIINNKKPTIKNSLEKSSEQLILTITKAKSILKKYNQNNINNLINFFLEKDVSGFYQTNQLLFISNLFHFSQKL